MTISRDGLSYDVVIDRKVTMKARDGVTFAMDIYRPAAGDQPLEGRWPVLVERTPYDRGLWRIERFGRQAAARGYVFVSQDVRGRNESEGLFEMMTGAHDEGADGFDTLSWIHAQPWCDGRIGTVGGSYSATNQQAAALEHPPGLCAQVLRDCGTNYYQRSFRVHGTFNVGNTLAWIVHSASLGREAMADPKVKAAIGDMRDNLADWVARLPIKKGQSPIALSSEYEDYYFKMEERSDDQPYWQSTGLRIEGRYDDYPTDVAPLLITGWFATHAAANFDKFVEFRKRLKKPVQIISGPWIHSPSMLQDTSAGIADFGEAAGMLGPIDERWLDWTDRWVRGIENGIDREPAVRYFMMGTGDGHWTEKGLVFHGGEWCGAEQWPLPATAFTPFYLADDGRLDREPGAREPARFTFDPNDPAPGLGSNTAQLIEFSAFVMPGPRDQRCSPEFAACKGSDRPIRERADVLVFETEPLAEGIEVTGPLEVRLWVSSSAPDTDFTAKLIDAYPPSDDHPEGFAMLISEGIVRMRYRNGRVKQDLIKPGEIYEIAIELTPTSNFFKRGHRIRLDISSSSFPQHDVNPNTGEPLGHHSKMVVAEQAVFRDLVRPSHILLPVVPA
ncbi:hypothetical protein A8G00_10705 [Sphingobium sp. SA916]|nr:hypothetical protein A8G00_10705 [Sphingobium sp. SA916]